MYIVYTYYKNFSITFCLPDGYINIIVTITSIITGLRMELSYAYVCVHSAHAFIDMHAHAATCLKA